MLYRLFRYRESTDSTAPDELYDREFAHDEPTLEPSVYKIKEHQIPQVTAEHFAAIPTPMGPPRFIRGVDVSPLMDGRPAETEAPFAFVRTAHHVLSLLDKTKLREFVTLLFRLMKDRPELCYNDSKEPIKKYIASRLAAGDPEWANFMETASKEWQKLGRP